MQEAGAIVLTEYGATEAPEHPGSSLEMLKPGVESEFHGGRK